MISDRIIRRREHDRNDRCGLLCSQHCRDSAGRNDIDLEPDKFGREFGEQLVTSLRPAIDDRNRPILDPAEFAQSLHKSSDPFARR
jgi:hypothetical protein